MKEYVENKLMDEQYTEPEMSVIEMKMADIITSSQNETEEDFMNSIENN